LVVRTNCRSGPCSRRERWRSFATPSHWTFAPPVSAVDPSSAVQRLERMQTISNDPGYQLTAALLRAADALLRGSQKLFRPHGLTAAQFNVLNLIAGSESGMSQRELSDKLVVDRSNVTGLLDRMEKAGWVRREDDPDDRRIYRISLSITGRKLWEKVNPQYLAAVAEVTQGFSRNQIRNCIDLLVRMTHASAGWVAILPETKKSESRGRHLKKIRS
jgi:DNA-binding MarR family transcriptional regulator